MAKELVQRVLVRACGSRLGPVTTRVGWDVRSTSSTALLSAIESGNDVSMIPEDDRTTGERSPARIRLTQSAFSSSRASLATTSGGALGSRPFGVEGRKTKRELRMKFEHVPATIPRKAAI